VRFCAVFEDDNLFGQPHHVLAPIELTSKARGIRTSERANRQKWNLSRAKAAGPGTREAKQARGHSLLRVEFLVARARAAESESGGWERQREGTGSREKTTTTRRVGEETDAEGKRREGRNGQQPVKGN
jgi:hypothetical protein